MSTFVSFDQTKATNVEASLTSVFLENLLQANLAVSQTTYRDLDGDGPGYTAVIRSNDRSEFGVKVGYTF